MDCRGCKYAVCLSGDWCCDYLLRTGHRRPCPSGEGCTVREDADVLQQRRGVGIVVMTRKDWDTVQARALYDQGCTDRQIAAELGTSVSAVGYWRRKLHLPANRPTQTETPMSEAPAARADPPGAVELFVAWNGCGFSLYAPDLAGAV